MGCAAMTVTTIAKLKKPRPRKVTESRLQRSFLLCERLLFAFFFCFLGFPAFTLRLETLFLPLRPIRRPFHQFRTNQFQHGQLRAIALAISEPRNPRVTALSLPEAGPQRVEQLLNGLRRSQKRRRLPARMQCVALGE